MTSENISYQDALNFKKNKCCTSVLKYSDMINSQSPASKNMAPKFSPQVEDFP
jgi:hypothetical protein